MTYKPGMLVVVPFPFADLSFGKKCPVLVLTFPDRYGDFIGLAITSVPTQENAMHLEPSDLISGALPLPSWVRLDKVYTLGTESITHELAEVRPDVLVRIVRGTCAKQAFHLVTTADTPSAKQADQQVPPFFGNR